MASAQPDPDALGRAQIEADQERSALTEISNEVVRVFKSQFGRGPTSARASWAAPTR